MKNSIIEIVALTFLIMACDDSLMGPQTEFQLLRTYQSRVTTLAGGVPGYSDGIGTDAKFNRPHGIVFDNDQILYIADSGNDRIRKMNPDLNVTTMAGSIRGYLDSAWFYYPVGLAISQTGDLLVTEYNNKIRIISPGGTVRTWVGGESSGDHDTTGVQFEFTTPQGITEASDGTIYVSMGWSMEDRHTIYTLSRDGIVSTLAGSGLPGYKDGPGETAQFHTPADVKLSPDESTLYVSDATNHVIRAIDISSGMVSTYAGTPGDIGYRDGPADQAKFYFPLGIDIDAGGAIYVADGNHVIRIITPDKRVETLAGTGEPGYEDGAGNQARFNLPWGIAIDKEGNIIVTEWENATVRKITIK